MATSGNTLLRNIGSSVGTAIIGTIFATQLASKLARVFPHSPELVKSSRSMSSAALAALPPDVRSSFLDVYSQSLSTAFRVAGVRVHLGVCGVLVYKGAPYEEHRHHRGNWRSVRQSSLRRTPWPKSAGLSASWLGGRRWWPTLPGWRPRPAWTCRWPVAGCWWSSAVTPRCREPDIRALAQRQKITVEAVDGAIRDVKDRGLCNSDLQLTDAGLETAERLTSAVRERLQTLLEGWSPEQYPDLVQLLDHFAAEIVAGSTVAAQATAGDQAA